MIKIKIQNGAEIRSFFDKLGVNFDEAVDVALNDTSDKIARGANQNLSNGIGVNSDLFGSVMSDNNRQFRKTIGTKIDYAPYVEFGTGPQHIDKKGQPDARKTYWPPGNPDRYQSLKYYQQGKELEKWRKMKAGGKFKNYDELRYSTYRFGTAPQSFMRSSLQTNRRKFAEYLGKRLAEMVNTTFVKR